MDEHCIHQSLVSSLVQYYYTLTHRDTSVYIVMNLIEECDDENRRGSFDEGDTEYDEIRRPIAYERVLRTWGDWVDHHIDPLRTTVFFMSMSPLHIK